MTHGESSKVQETRGNSGLTVFARKTAAELPEEVLERIIYRIPFPSLFKARLLSKTWYFNFPLAPQSVKSVSPSVRNLISSVSSKWATYCPCYVSQEAILGFDRASSRWQTLMSISHPSTSNWNYVSSAGSLVCVTKFHDNRSVFITNSLNGSWRKLNFPLPTLTDYPLKPPVTKIILQGSDAYKVLRLFQQNGNSVYSNVYDSSTRTYTGNTALGVTCFNIHRASAYLDGKVYYMFDDFDDMCVSLWIYNVENNEWSTIANCHDLCADCAVLLCGDKVMVAVRTLLDEGNDIDDEEDEGTEWSILEESIHVFELDVVTLELKPVSSGPPQTTYGVRTGDGPMKFASDSNFIYFDQDLLGTTAWSYNICNDEWDCLPPASYNLSSQEWVMADAFQPGLCPFMIA